MCFYNFDSQSNWGSCNSPDFSLWIPGSLHNSVMPKQYRLTMEHHPLWGGYLVPSVSSPCPLTMDHRPLGGGNLVTGASSPCPFPYFCAKLRQGYWCHYKWYQAGTNLSIFKSNKPNLNVKRENLGPKTQQRKCAILPMWFNTSTHIRNLNTFSWGPARCQQCDAVAH